MPSPAAARPTRKDAVRNRARLIETAAAVLRDQGLDASVNAIAKAAGVNVATLYRHFPAKDDLVLAVLDAVLEPLTLARDEALAADGDVLATFLRAAVTLQSGHRGLDDVLTGRPTTGALRARLRDPAAAIVEPLIERAHAEGSLRPDFGAIDVLVTLKMLSGLPIAPGLQPPLDRYVAVVLRGLRPG